MMPLEDQICTKEQAQRIEELGVRAESYFVWIYGSPANKKSKFGWCLIARDDAAAYTFMNKVNAYSCAELLCMCDQMQKIANAAWNKNELIDLFNKNLWDNINGWHLQNPNVSAAHQIAQLIIFTLQEKIIKPEDVKL